MAINKKHTLKGFDITYWHISEMRWSKLDNQTTVQFKGYKDKETRDIDINNSIFDAYFVVPEDVDRETAYIWILKNIEFFKDGAIE